MVTHLVHKLRESRRVIDGLRLEKLRPAGHFVLHTPEFGLPIRGARIDYRPHTEGRCALERLPTQVCARLQSGHRLQQPEHVQVENRLGVRMIPGSWRIAGHAHQVTHPQR